MTIEERLESIERRLSAAKLRNRYLLIGLAALAVGWVSMSTTGTIQAQTSENTVRAEKFELVDSQGNVRAALTETDAGPLLYLSDENGNVRVALNATDAGPGLNLWDKNEKLRVALTVLGSGTGLALSDENEKLRASLGFSDSGSWLVLKDENGRPIWSAP
jgi:hypothetical protein